MAAPVQQRSTRSTTGVASLALAFLSNVTAGNTVIVSAGGHRSSAGLGETITGSSFTFTERAENLTTASITEQNTIADSINTAGGAQTCTTTPTNSQEVSIAIYEYAAITGFGLATVGNAAAATTPTATMSGPTTTADAILFATIVQDGATTTIAPEAGWTTREVNEDATHVAWEDEDRTVAATATYSHQWTLGASRDVQWIIAAWYLPSSGGATVRPRSLLTLGVGS